MNSCMYRFLPAMLVALLSTATVALAQEKPPSPKEAARAQAAANDDIEGTFDLEGALLSREGGLTADEAGKRARARSPQLASARASATTARWDAKTQWSSFLPQLQVSGQYKRINRVENQLFDTGSGAPPDTSGVADPAARALFDGLFRSFGLGSDSVDFTQPVDNYAVAASARVPVSELFLRVFPNYKAADHIADARAVEVETRAATVELAAREAFYAYARAVATQLVAERALAQAEAQAAQAKLFVDAGTAAPVDLMTATARSEAMRSRLARTRGAVAITRNTLSTLTGIPSSEVAAIREPVTSLPEPPREDLDALLTRALESRPELRAMRKLLDANEQQHRAERNAALPTLSVDGNVLHANPNPRYVPPLKQFRTTWEVGATLAWTPNSAVTGYQRARRAESELEKVHADLAALEDGVRIDVVQAFEDYKAADAAARASEAQLGAADETYRVRLATYRVGAGVQIDLLAADLAVTQARVDRVNATIDARIALAQLRRAIGASGR